MSLYDLVSILLGVHRGESSGTRPESPYSGRGRFAWVTIAPMLFVGTTTVTAAIQSIFQNFIPAGAYLSAAISAIMLVCVFVIFVASARGWAAHFRTRTEPAEDPP